MEIVPWTTLHITLLRRQANFPKSVIRYQNAAWAERLGLDYSSLVDGQLSDSCATGVFPNVQIGCHPEAVFLMRFR